MKPTKGEFVKIKKDAKFRPGQDAPIVDVDGDRIGLIFAYDREGQAIDGSFSVGTEEWSLDEIDLSSRSKP